MPKQPSDGRLLRSEIKQCSRGTHRVASLEETMEHIEPHLREMRITRTANVTGLDHIGIPVVMTYRPGDCGLAVYQGKGTTIAAARVSGAMEAVERFHAEHLDVPVTWGRYSDFTADDGALDPALLLRSDEAINPGNARIPWTPCFDVVRQDTVLVPLEVIAHQPSLNRPKSQELFHSTSTGLASGNSLTEAVVHATCEVVERDAHTFWTVLTDREKKERRIAPDSIDDPDCQALLRKFEDSEVLVAIWDMSNEFRVATFLVHVLDCNAAVGAPSHAIGAGTHLTRETALSRALTEAAQSRLTLIVGSRDDIQRSHYRRRSKKELEWIYDLYKHGNKPRRFGDCPTYVSNDIAEDLNWLSIQIATKGLSRILFCDLSRPKFDIPVVRVVIPCMEDGYGIADYAPGPRLRRRLHETKLVKGVC